MGSRLRLAMKLRVLLFVVLLCNDESRNFNASENYSVISPRKTRVSREGRHLWIALKLSACNISLSLFRRDLRGVEVTDACSSSSFKRTESVIGSCIDFLSFLIFN
jgi:hypothetical protein